MFSLQLVSWLLPSVLLSCLLPSVLSSPPPNIVVILADDLGLYDVPWHNTDTLVRNSILWGWKSNSPVVQVAPSLAALAKEGVVLEQHYSQSTCSPSRAALLTGRWQTQQK